MTKVTHDSSAQRDRLELKIDGIAEKLQTLALFMLGKHINGQEIDSNGGWCGRTDKMLHSHEQQLRHVPTARELWKIMAVGTFLWSVVVSIAAFLVWAHKP